ncbi:MAG: hypothetical protein ACKO13_17415 [Cytophagales bacterium]
MIVLFSFVRCNETAQPKSVQDLKRELLPSNFEQTATQLFDAIYSGLQTINYEQGWTSSIKKLGLQMGASTSEIEKAQKSIYYKKSGSVDTKFFTGLFSVKSKEHFDNLLSIFNKMQNFRNDGNFDFDSYLKSAISQIEKTEKQVVYDNSISSQEKQMILIASTLMSVGVSSMEASAKAIASQDFARVACFFCDLWDAVVKVVSVVVSVVVNVVVGFFVSLAGGFSSGILAAPFCAVGGAFVGLLSGIRDGINCDSFDFSCMTSSLNPPNDYPCAL